MQRTGAAESHQREVARIVSLLHGYHPQRAEHVFVDDVDDAGRGFLEPDAHRIGDFLYGGFGGFFIEFEFAAKERFRQVSKYDICIGYGGSCAADSVACRPGVRAGAFRTDPQCLGQFRYVGDRSAARADRFYVQRRCTYLEMSHIRVSNQAWLAVFDECDVRGRAAHVECQYVFETRIVGDPQRTGDATRRSR